jgi:dATP pyrophosphohydrolase
MRQPIQVQVFPVKVVSGQRIYLMLHRIARIGSFWQGVTGGVEGGEAILDAAKRELLEETGFVPIEIHKIDYTYSYPVEDRWRYLYAAGVETIHEHVFVAQVDGQAMPSIDPEEHDQWEWCDLNRALGLLTWPGNIEALKRCDDFLSEREAR